MFYYVSAIFGVQAIIQQVTKQATNPKKRGKEKIINSISVGNLRSDFNSRLISSLNRHDVDDGKTLFRGTCE